MLLASNASRLGRAGILPYLGRGTVHLVSSIAVGALAGCSEYAAPVAPLDPASAAVASLNTEDPYANVGAVTPFSRWNSLDLASFCNGADELSDQTCINAWVTAGEKQGKHLFVSPGTYIYDSVVKLYNGVQLRCGDPNTTVFKNVRYGRGRFVLSPNFSGGATPYADVRFENCGLDLNGDTTNFASAISIAGPVSNVTIKNNRIFDSFQPGEMYTSNSRQRQYIVVLNVKDLLIQGNRLSEGGRIKAGRPGERIVIRGNRLYNVNDNAISVVTTPPQTSSDILIEYNHITNPLGAGIFFGSDGKSEGTLLQAVSNIIIRENQVHGDASACISGMLPNITERVYIYGNLCNKYTTAYNRPLDYDAGITLARSANSVLPVLDVTILGNTIVRDVPGAFRNGALFANIQTARTCIANNSFKVGTDLAIWLRINAESTVKLVSNALRGGVLRVEGGTVEHGTDLTGCWLW